MELQSQNQNKIDWRVTIMALNTDGLGIVDEQRELDGRDWINTVLHVFGTWINIGQANPIVMIEIEKEDKEQRTVPLYFCLFVENRQNTVGNVSSIYLMKLFL